MNITVINNKFWKFFHSIINETVTTLTVSANTCNTYGGSHDFITIGYVFDEGLHRG